MENITTSYLTRAEIWLCITTLVYFMMNGAQIFETLVFVPKWTASPPDDFRLLLEGRGISLKIFWILFHSLHEITFLLALYFCWKIDPVRNWLLVLLVLHFAVRFWTLSYFAPTIIDFQKMAALSNDTENLTSRVSLWKTLNYVRVLLFIAISLGLIPLCIRLFSIRN